PRPAAGADASARAATAPSGALRPGEPPRAAPAQAAAPKRGDGEGAGVAPTSRVFSSPLARRLAKEAGIDLARIPGSGPHGRVIAHDVELAKSGRGVTAPAAPAAAPPVQAPADEKILALFEPGSYEAVPHDNVRKVIARRLLEAKLTIPHFYLTL